jgi:pimeloyl-ACP methyl ester carboxylesterase
MARSLCIALLLLTCSLSAQNFSTQYNEEHGVRNIVLGHGARADGSGWRGVYDILVKDGYNVSIVQEPEASFEDDVAATKRLLALQEGPCILVAHGYGGAVITEAGIDPSVAGLVHIAAHMPDAGENDADDGKRFPSDLSKSGGSRRRQTPSLTSTPGSFMSTLRPTCRLSRRFSWCDRRCRTKPTILKAVITATAWRSKPSWMLVAGSDRAIKPDIERWYPTRASSHNVEVSGASHADNASRPKEVAAVIEEAASHARK